MPWWCGHVSRVWWVGTLRSLCQVQQSHLKWSRTVNRKGEQGVSKVFLTFNSDNFNLELQWAANRLNRTSWLIYFVQAQDVLLYHATFPLTPISSQHKLVTSAILRIMSNVDIAVTYAANKLIFWSTTLGSTNELQPWCSTNVCCWKLIVGHLNPKVCPIPEENNR